MTTCQPAASQDRTQRLPQCSRHRNQTLNVAACTIASALTVHTYTRAFAVQSSSLIPRSALQDTHCTCLHSRLRARSRRCCLVQVWLLPITVTLHVAVFIIAPVPKLPPPVEYATLCMQFRRLAGLVETGTHMTWCFADTQLRQVGKHCNWKTHTDLDIHMQSLIHAGLPLQSGLLTLGFALARIFIDLGNILCPLDALQPQTGSSRCQPQKVWQVPQQPAMHSAVPC